MKTSTRLPAKAAAVEFLNKYQTNCNVAILGGSSLRNYVHNNSDINIVIIGPTPETRLACFEESGWNIQAYIIPVDSWKNEFSKVPKTRIPTLLRICTEGIVLQDDNKLSKQVKGVAQNLLVRGPEILSLEERLTWRKEMGRVLDDFEALENLDESIFAANQIVSLSCDMLLLFNRQWMGLGKWQLRTLRVFDDTLADELMDSLHKFYYLGQKDKLLQIGKIILEACGGRVWHGYSQPLP